MAVVIDPTLCGSIRLILSETEETLTDAQIMDPLTGLAAERRVLGLIGAPPYADRLPEDQASIRQAVGYLTAASIVRGRRRAYAITGETFSNQYKYTSGSVDLDGWLDELEREGMAALAGLIAEVEPAGLSMFTVAKGGRGR